MSRRPIVPTIGRPRIDGITPARSRAMVKLAWQPSAGQAFTATHGRYQLSLMHNPSLNQWFVIVFDTRQYAIAACLNDADVNVLRAEISRQVADLDILEGN